MACESAGMLICLSSALRKTSQRYTFCTYSLELEVKEYLGTLEGMQCKSRCKYSVRRKIASFRALGKPKKKQKDPQRQNME